MPFKRIYLIVADSLGVGEEPDAVDFGRDGEAEEQQQDDGHDEHDGDRARVAQEVEHLFPDE